MKKITEINLLKVQVVKASEQRDTLAVDNAKLALTLAEIQLQQSTSNRVQVVKQVLEEEKVSPLSQIDVATGELKNWELPDTKPPE